MIDVAPFILNYMRIPRLDEREEIETRKLKGILNDLLTELGLGKI
jgi:hypothetical protein